MPKEREEPENGGERGLSVQTVGGRILAGYESSGVPTYMQARGLGMSFSQWSELCRSAFNKDQFYVTDDFYTVFYQDGDLGAGGKTVFESGKDIRMEGP